MMKERPGHLVLMPTPRSPRPVERIDSATILARAAGRDDCRRTIDGLRLLTSRQEDIIATLDRELDEAGEALTDTLGDFYNATEDCEHWAVRAVVAERSSRLWCFATWGAIGLAALSVWALH